MGLPCSHARSQPERPLEAPSLCVSPASGVAPAKSRAAALLPRPLAAAPLAPAVVLSVPVGRPAERVTGMPGEVMIAGLIAVVTGVLSDLMTGPFDRSRGRMHLPARPFRRFRQASARPAWIAR